MLIIFVNCNTFYDMLWQVGDRMAKKRSGLSAVNQKARSVREMHFDLNHQVHHDLPGLH